MVEEDDDSGHGVTAPWLYPRDCPPRTRGARLESLITARGRLKPVGGIEPPKRQPRAVGGVAPRLPRFRAVVRGRRPTTPAERAPTTIPSRPQSCRSWKLAEGVAPSRSSIGACFSERVGVAPNAVLVAAHHYRLRSDATARPRASRSSSEEARHATPDTHAGSEQVCAGVVLPPVSKAAQYIKTLVVVTAYSTPSISSENCSRLYILSYRSVLNVTWIYCCVGYTPVVKGISQRHTREGTHYCSLTIQPSRMAHTRVVQNLYVPYSTENNTQMSETDFDALGDELDSASNDSSGGDDDGVRYWDAPSVKARPQTIVDAEEILDLSFTGDFTDEQNLRGGHWQDMGAAVIVLKNPTVVEGEVWTDEDRENFRVLSMDAEDVSENITKDDDGNFETVGVDIGSGTFGDENSPTEQIDDLTAPAGEYLDEDTIADGDEQSETGLSGDDDVVQVFVDNGMGQHILRLLDCLGGVSAYFTDPEDETDYDAQTNGLVEFPDDYGTDGYEPGEDDDYPRIARLPTLRSDLEGEPVRFVFVFGDDSGGFTAHNCHIVAIDEVGQEVDLSTAGERKYHKPDETTDVGEPEMRSYLVWDDPADNLDNSDQSMEDATEDIEFSAMSNEGDGDVGFDDLEEAWQQFVYTAHENGLKTSDFDDWETTVEQAIEDDGLPERDADVVGAILDEQTEQIEA